MFSYITVEVPSTEAELVILGDLHYGAEDQDRKPIKKALEYVANKDNAYVMSIGDNLDLSTAKSYGVIGITPSPQDAIQNLSRDFRKTAELGKLIGFLQGNHDVRLVKQTGTDLDLTQALVNEWNDIYNGLIQYGKPVLLVRFKVQRYNGWDSFVFCFVHGCGGGRNPGTVANWMTRMRNLVTNADVYAQGHHHQPMIAVRNLKMFHAGHGLVNKVQTFITVGGHVHDAEYAETKMLESCPALNAKVKMTGAPKGNQQKTLTVEWM